MDTTTNNNKLLYSPNDSKVIKYASDPNGIIVATVKATINNETYIIVNFYLVR